MLWYIPDDFPVLHLCRFLIENGYAPEHWHSTLAGEKVVIVSRRDLETTMKRVQEGLEVYVSE